MLAASVAMTVLMTVGAGTGLAPTYRPLLNLPFLQGAAIAVVLSGVFWWFHREGRDSVVPAEYYRSPLLLTAILLLFLKVSFEVESYFTLGDAARAGQGVKSLLTLSVVWGLYAGAVIVSGFLSRYKPLRLLGISLLALTVFKVFLLDVQALDRGYRIVAFLVLGVLSLGISMLYQQERKGVPGGTRKDETLPDRPGKPE